MCLDVFGAWINRNKSFDWDINLENSIICKYSFFKYKILVMDYAWSCNECAHGLLKSTHGKY